MIPWNIICKCIPSEWFSCFGIKDDVVVREESASRVFSKKMRKYLQNRVKIEQEKLSNMNKESMMSEKYNTLNLNDIKMD